MHPGYTDEEIALMRRDAKRKDEYEINLIKRTAWEEGFAEGLAKGKTKSLNNTIIKIHKNGFDSETIAKFLSLDISYVNEVLKNN